jgi:ABC-type uncharacterized transport system ATPase subunit
MENENKPVVVFIYAKDGRIKVLGLDDAYEQHDYLPSEGWVHTATLDACIFLQFLHNDCSLFEKIKQINKLGHKL